MSITGFVSGAVRVLVPASSANLGPGFDAMGLALDINDELIAMVTEDDGVLVEIEGEGAESLPRDETHLVVQAMFHGFDIMGKRPPGFILKCRNAIPHSRGLGSSASAIVGGLMMARSLVTDGETLMNDSAILNAALHFENHPDNLSAALYGGFTVSWIEGPDVADSVSLTLHPDIVPILLIPPHVLATSQARGVIPEKVTMQAACHNLSRAGLLVYALSQDPKVLLPATSDQLHQSIRGSVYPETIRIIDGFRSQGVAAVASGAGPAVLVLMPKENAPDFERFATHVSEEWARIAVPVSYHGARQVPLNS